MNNLTFVDWGLIPYSEAFEKQKELFEATIRQKSEQKATQSTVIFCEHPHVITIGKNGSVSNILYQEKTLKEKQVELYHVDRGGDVTYHGPGQLVGYPVIDLDAFRMGLKAYIFLLEEIIIQLLDQYLLKGERLAGAAGVWLHDGHPHNARKICAIGVKSSHYVTMHGFALNVNTNLDYFRNINPCGFVDKSVTSLAAETGKTIEMPVLKTFLRENIIKVFENI